MTYTAALDSVLGEIKPSRKSSKPKQQPSLCDSCGIRAAYEATKGTSHLNFCGHHARKNAASLLERGFTIAPEDYMFDTKN